MGHAAGDALLKEIGARLCRNTPPPATVARIGGDEFAIIVPGLTVAEANEAKVRAALHGLDLPVPFGGRMIDTHVSAGVAVWPRDGDDAAEVL